MKEVPGRGVRLQREALGRKGPDILFEGMWGEGLDPMAEARAPGPFQQALQPPRQSNWVLLFSLGSVLSGGQSFSRRP